MAMLVKQPLDLNPTGWAVLSADGLPDRDFNRYLAHLHSLEKSRNTIRAYASDLRFYAEFLECTGTVWTAATPESLGNFLAYLRQPWVAVKGRARGALIQREATTVNRMMAAVSGFYRFMAVSSGDRTFSRLAAYAGRKYRPVRSVVDGVVGTSRSREITSIGPRLRSQPALIETLNPDQAARIMAACTTLRDKLLIATLFHTGMRVGQALGLRHEDLCVPDRTITLTRRDQRGELHANKSWRPAIVPVPQELTRLYVASPVSGCASRGGCTAY